MRPPTDRPRGSADSSARKRQPTSPPSRSSQSQASRSQSSQSQSQARPPRPRRRWLRWVVRIFEAGTLMVALGLLVLWCSVPRTSVLATENPTSTAFIDLRRAEAADAARAFTLKWTWRPLGKISRYLRAAVIYAEDYNFYRHDGVDWGAIEEAVSSNWDKGSLAVGGSTITQQLAKNLYLSPRRSMLRKARELLIAYSLEDHLSKQRILELYLNIVEWGDGVFGAEAAAQHWFGHSAQSLTPAEATRLAIALPNPLTRSPRTHTPQLTRKSIRIIHALRLQGLLDAAQERTALDEVGAPDEKVLTLRARPVRGPPVPDPGQPAAGQPPTGDPAPPAGQPDPGQPDPGQPDPGQPPAGQPPAGQPPTGQPDPGQPASE